MGADGIRNSNSGLKVEINTSRQRQTPKTDFGTMLKSGASRTADALLNASQLAAPYIPGAGVVSAAISGLGGLKQSMGASTNAGGYSGNGVSANLASTQGSSGLGATYGGGGSVGGAMSLESRAASGDTSAANLLETREIQEMNQSFNLQYLSLQQKMQGENRQFTALSNIMKTKHDTAKNAISNVR